MELVTVGKVINIRGLKGELKIESLTDFANLRYKKGNLIILEDEVNNIVVKFKVKSHFNNGRFDYIQFDGINDVDQARAFLGYYLKVEIDTSKPLDGDTFYYHQLIGCEVILENNSKIGIVTKVEDIGPHHILRVKSESRKADILIPFLWQFMLKVDIKNKQIMIKEVAGLL
jgi:16S rRNA processing protein RimM